MAYLSKSNTNLVVDPEGNVGVQGTTVIEDSLPALIFRDTDDGAENSIAVNSGELYVGGTEEGRTIYLRSKPSFGTSVIIDVVGRLGIGRTPVADKLEIAGAVTSHGGHFKAYNSDTAQSLFHSTGADIIGADTRFQFKNTAGATSYLTLRHYSNTLGLWNGGSRIAYVDSDNVLKATSLRVNTDTNGMELGSNVLSIYSGTYGYINFKDSRTAGNDVQIRRSGTGLYFYNNGVHNFNLTNDRGQFMQALQVNGYLTASGGFQSTLNADFSSVDISGTLATLSAVNHTVTGNLNLQKNWATYGSYSGTMLHCSMVRAATPSVHFFYATSSNGADAEFRMTGQGSGYCDDAWKGGGADYADLFEWADGNPSSEDRAGITVVNEGDKIRPAQSGETPIGVVSRLAVIVGNTGWNKWVEKHLKDDYGAYLYHDVDYVEWTIKDEDGKDKQMLFKADEIPAGVPVPVAAERYTNSERVVNPDWDPDAEYVAREERPEWEPVGLLGRVRITKGQPTASTWIKLRDVSDTVEEWLIR